MLPRNYYLKRAVESYEQAGLPAEAAALLATFGTREASSEAAKRYLALGDVATAGEAYLAAQQLPMALRCFQHMGLRERELACLQALGDEARAGVLLLALGRVAEAIPLLERTRATSSDPVLQAERSFQLAQAYAERDAASAKRSYQAGLAVLGALPIDAASAGAWAALGAWGAAVGRQDRMQEGYAQAQRLLHAAGDTTQWRQVTREYRAAAQRLGNRRLVQILDAALNDQPASTTLAPPPPDPVLALLAAGQWTQALAKLEPRARAGDGMAKELLAVLIEGAALGSAALLADLQLPTLPPLPQRLAAARSLGAVGDVRLLDLDRGTNMFDTYWCELDTQPVWFGDERWAVLHQIALPQPVRIGRYPVTNQEYERFIAAGGYQVPHWWSEVGWGWKFTRAQPTYWENRQYNQPNQPVVGVSWYEAAAYGRWLTAQGHQAGWLATHDSLRLPTALEWERAARHTDQRHYPWGNATPDAERANHHANRIGYPTPVGCFPAGAAVCGALDLAGNVVEWLATASREPDQARPRDDIASRENVLCASSNFQSLPEDLCCGTRDAWSPMLKYHHHGFRLVWALGG